MGADPLFVLELIAMALLLILVVVCGITDVLYQRIWNKVTLPAIGIGLLLNLVAIAFHTQLGLQYFMASLIATIVGFTIILIIFLFGGMGGGDVKYMAAIGALDPFHFGHQWILWSIFYSVLAGGVISMVVMTLHGRLLRSFRNVFRTIFTFVTPGLETEPLKREDSMTIPFGLGISLGTLWTILLFHLRVLPN